MKDKIDIRLNLGGCDWLNKESNIIVHNMSNHELEDGYPTLRDVAVILYRCVGQGVEWNLAREISLRTGFNLRILAKTINKIILEYANLTEEEGYKKFEEIGGYINIDET